MNRLITINNTFESFQSLIKLYVTNKNKLFGDIHLEIHSFFAANMITALGAVLDKLYH
jgi:hypothetical protein